MVHHLPDAGSMLAPVAGTGFSHRLTAYKIVGHFIGLSYRKISGSNQVKKSFLGISNISVPCPHAQLRGRTVIKKLWTFFGPWCRDVSYYPAGICCRFKWSSIIQTLLSLITRCKRLDNKGRTRSAGHGHPAGLKFGQDLCFSPSINTALDFKCIHFFLGGEAGFTIHIGFDSCPLSGDLITRYR